MRVVHVVSVSSGKDSQALLDLAVKRCPPGSVRPIFCDTDNEDAAVYEHLAYLEMLHGIRIERLKADFSAELAAKRMFIARDQRKGRDKSGRKVRWSNKAKRRALAVMYPTGNAFLDLCMWKGRFPSRKAQFCTQELKTHMAVQYQLDLVEQGYRVISWQGVRRDESHNRRNAKRIERIAPRIWSFRPLVEWSAMQVIRHCTSQGQVMNRLYSEGSTRVGCMPCINSNKAEVREIALRRPEHIARIAEWERKVSDCSKRGFSTFMADAHEASDRRQVFADLNIHARVEWSKTTRGGKQFQLFENTDSAVCASAYGLCE